MFGTECRFVGSTVVVALVPNNTKMSFIDELSTRSKVIDAVSRYPTDLQFASDAFKDDYEIVLAAVTSDKDRTNAKYSADACVRVNVRNAFK